jgi:hypothetical protein
MPHSASAETWKCDLCYANNPITSVDCYACHRNRTAAIAHKITLDAEAKELKWAQERELTLAKEASGCRAVKTYIPEAIRSMPSVDEGIMAAHGNEPILVDWQHSRLDTIGTFAAMLGTVEAQGLIAMMNSDDVRDRLDVASIAYFAEARALRLRKQNDYGATWQVLGLKGIFVHVLTKVQRLKQLVWHNTEQQVKDESVRDTLIDLLNYAVISLYLLETNNLEGS